MIASIFNNTGQLHESKHPGKGMVYIPVYKHSYNYKNCIEIRQKIPTNLGKLIMISKENFQIYNNKIMDAIYK